MAGRIGRNGQRNAERESATDHTMHSLDFIALVLIEMAAGKMRRFNLDAISVTASGVVEMCRDGQIVKAAWTLRR